MAALLRYQTKANRIHLIERAFESLVVEGKDAVLVVYDLFAEPGKG